MRIFRSQSRKTRRSRLRTALRSANKLHSERLEQRLMMAAEIDIRNFNGLSIPDGDTTPTLTKLTDFGPVNVIGGKFTRTFTIANTGDARLNLTGSPRVQILGADAADFSITKLPGASVAASRSTSFQLTFDPSAGGSRAAIVKVLNNDANESSYDFVVRGQGATPEIDIRNFNGQSIADGDSTPTLAKQTDFGAIAVAGATFTRTFTVANTGNAPLSLTGRPRVQIVGADAADFSVVQLPTATVNAGGMTTFRITFDPSGIGSRAAIVKITSNDASEAFYDFIVKGTGVAGVPNVAVSGQASGSFNPIPDGDSTPEVIQGTDFGGLNVISGTATRTFRIANTGQGALNLITSPFVQIIGADATDFTVTSQPAGTVAAGGVTTFRISFDPSAIGTRQAIVKFTSNDPDTPFYDFVIKGVGLDSTPSSPSNNNFANRINLGAGNTVNGAGSNADATKEAGEPDHAGNPGGKSVWWQWTASATGTVQIDTIGSSFDTTLGVYTGTSVGALNSIAQNDDFTNGNGRSKVNFAATAGTTYVIAVDGFRFGSTTPASGTISLNVNLTPTPVSEFQITVVFPDNSLNAAQRAAFTTAANRWAQVITGDLPNVTVNGVAIDDVLIVATGPAIDGPGNILGQAGPTHIRTVGSLPARGEMQFDIADIQALEAAGQFVDVILHEMGHVLGVGTIWDNLGLLTGAGGTDPRFTGRNATREYNSIFGQVATSVPVANVGGPGSRDSHWRESVFGAELMSPNLNSGVRNPLSRVTVGGLQDLGYVVNYAAADVYNAPGRRLEELTTSELAAAEYDAEMIAPNWVVQRVGGSEVASITGLAFQIAAGAEFETSSATVFTETTETTATEKDVDSVAFARDYLFETDDIDLSPATASDSEIESALSSIDLEAKPQSAAATADTFFADLDRSARRKAAKKNEARFTRDASHQPGHGWTDLQVKFA